jgi:K+-sensing histidine kinase KdpD
MTTVAADRARRRERFESLFPNGVEHGFTTTEDGTGFGLSTVETICRAHGRDIRLDGGERGARFEITGTGPAEHSYPLTEELSLRRSDGTSD